MELEAESGDEEEEEELVATPPKRRKTERLSDEQMMERKLRIAEIVRRHANSTSLFLSFASFSGLYSIKSRKVWVKHEKILILSLKWIRAEAMVSLTLTGLV